MVAAGLLAPAISPGLALQEEVTSNGPQRTINVSGAGQTSAQPVVEQPVMAAEAAAAVPVEPGNQTIVVDLQVTWLLRGQE